MLYDEKRCYAVSIRAVGLYDLSIAVMQCHLTIRDERLRRATPIYYRAARGVRSIEWLGVMLALRSLKAALCIEFSIIALPGR